MFQNCSVLISKTAEIMLSCATSNLKLESRVFPEVRKADMLAFAIENQSVWSILFTLYLQGSEVVLVSVARLRRCMQRFDSQH